MTIGGQGIVAQMTAIDAEHAAPLLETYKEHNDGSMRRSRPSTSCSRCPRLKAEGRKLGIVTAKRHRTVGLALDRFLALAGIFDVVVAHEDTERRRIPTRCCSRSRDSTASPPTRSTSGTRRSTSSRKAGVFAVAVGWGGIHPDERLLAEEPDAFVRAPEELLGVI